MSYSSKFFHYALPSVGALLVVGLYFVVDGIFVAKGVGSTGLAAINLAVPFISVLSSITTMLAIGGATLASISLGERNIKQANVFFNTSITLILSIAVVFLFLTFLFLKEIALFLGCSNILLQPTMEYIKYYVAFDIFFSGTLALATFVRNDGNPRLAFWGMIIGAISNIFLDWLFIFVLHWGIKGAAVASGLGQIFSFVLLLSHFMKRKGELYFSRQILKKNNIYNIIKTGFPECITQMSSPITIFCYNVIIIKLLGEKGVAAYSIVSYLLVIVFAVFIGVAEGLQPLLSRSFGEKNGEALKQFFKVGIKTNISLACLIYGIFAVFGHRIIEIFTNDSDILQIAYACIGIYGISFLFASCNIVYTTFFLATKETGTAVKIAILRSVILNSLCIFTAAGFFQNNGIWLGIVSAEFLVLLYLYSGRLLRKPFANNV